MLVDYWVEDPLPTPSAPRGRHSWVKLRLHVYICRTCGLGKVNAQRANGKWFVTWHEPTGVSHTAAATPPCAVGPLTEKYLKKYESALACAEE